MEENKAICKDCENKWWGRKYKGSGVYEEFRLCKTDEIDYVTGNKVEKKCEELNKDGDCKNFKPIDNEKILQDKINDLTKDINVLQKDKYELQNKIDNINKMSILQFLRYKKIQRITW